MAIHEFSEEEKEMIFLAPEEAAYCIEEAIDGCVGRQVGRGGRRGRGREREKEDCKRVWLSTNSSEEEKEIHFFGS